MSGAAHGMGAEEARLFAREGAKVVIADVLDDEGTRLATELTAAGGEALFVHTDVTIDVQVCFWKARRPV
jgi:NAD(P)-dependent dehydrogenase (short-subunit alcohol dehydrogenase family)